MELNQSESSRTILSISTAHHSPTKPTVMDSHNRPHFRSPHTGPATINLRSACFYSSTSETHMSDLTPVMKAVVQEGRTVVTIIADGGPDWSTASLLNALFFMRMWRKCDLDILCVTSFAARYSAYNPIEHLWSSMSKRLTSVQLSAIAEGDSKPPCHVSGILKQQRQAKEKEVFDWAIAEVANVHWKEASFDGYPVVGVPVECKSETNSDHDMVSQFLKAPLKALREGKFDSLLVEYKFLLSHVRRHHNEIMFLNCESSTCEHCSKHPIRATESFSFLRDREMKMFNPFQAHSTLGTTVPSKKCAIRALLSCQQQTNTYLL